jgi:hypothetical protein
VNRTTKIQGISALAASTAVLLWISLLLNKTSSSMSSALVLTAGIQSVAAFWVLLSALSKSNRVFFSVFVGDALLRLAVLGVALAWIGSRHADYTAPLLSLGFSYLVLSLVQVPFFCRVV